MLIIVNGSRGPQVWSGFITGSKEERALVVRQKVIFYRMRLEEQTADFDVGDIVLFYVVTTVPAFFLEQDVITFQSCNGVLFSEFLSIFPKINKTVSQKISMM